MEENKEYPEIQKEVNGEESEKYWSIVTDTDENKPEKFKKEYQLKEAIEVLCNTLKDRNLFEDNGLKPQMLTTKKLEILKTIANSMRIDWDEVVQDDKIISLELKLFKPINK